MLPWSSHNCEKPERFPRIVLIEEVDLTASRIKGVRIIEGKIRVDIFSVKDSEKSSRELLFSEDLEHGVAGFEGASHKRFPLDGKDIYVFLRAPLEKRR